MSRSWRLSLPLLVIALLGFVVPAAQAAAPANDNFASASPVSLGTTVNGTTAEATREDGEPAEYDLGIGHTVWYRWTANVSGHILVSTTDVGGGQWKDVGVYTGSPVSALTEVDEYSGWVHFDAVAGSVYDIRVDAIGTDPRDAAFTLTLQRAGTIEVTPTLNGAAVVPRLCVLADPDSNGEGGETFIWDGTTFDLPVPVGHHVVSVSNCNQRDVNVAPVLLSTDVAADQTVRFSPALTMGAVVTGTVTPAAGKSQGGCVTVTMPGNGLRQMDGCPDSAGHYRIDSLATGSFYVLGGDSDYGYPHATTEDQLVPVGLTAGCVTTVDANDATQTITVVGRDCSALPACQSAHAAVASANHVLAVKTKALTKAKKKDKKAKKHHASNKKLKKLKKKVKKATKAKKHAASVRNAAAATEQSTCH